MNAMLWVGVVGSAVLAFGCSKKDAGSPAPDGTNQAGAGGMPAAGGAGLDAAGRAGDRNGAAGTDPSAAGSSGAPPAPAGLVIQENETGFCAVDGKILPEQGSTSVTGYTGDGFADGDTALGTSISWSVSTEASGAYELLWRYAFGGTETNLRDARLFVNEELVAENVVFAYTSTWNDWATTPPLEVALEEGSNFIRLEALYPNGLANIDYLQILGEGLTPDAPRFTLSVGQNAPERGTVSYSPLEPSYPVGTSITLTATAGDGYFLQSWSGDVTSAEQSTSFAIEKNTRVTALFLPDGTTQDPDLTGYATIQDDAGTPYLVTGGSLGESVTATTLDELRTYLGSPDPYVVSFSGLIEGVDSIPIASDKTLLGVGDSAHLQGLELSIDGSRNVIVRNVSVSHVVAEGSGDANDAIVITGGAKNVWIDHCDLFSDRTHGEDYYDGLLEIKNAASFVTVSWSVFHDHYKVSLISSGDEQVADTAIRATYHHNTFHDCGSRLPSIRFGKAHIFDNYFLDNTAGSCINSRMGAVVRVENNYFENSKNPIGAWDSPISGFWEVSNNVFDQCTGSQPTDSTGSLAPPYTYELDAPEDVPELVAAQAGVGKL